MSFKEKIDNHPLIFATGTAVSAGVVVAAVVMFGATIKYEAEQNVLKAEYEHQLSKYRAIERVIPDESGDEKSYFDIGKLVIRPDRIPALGPEFKTMADGQFFVSEPQMTDWRFSEVNMLELHEFSWRVVPRWKDRVSAPEVLRSFPVYLWSIKSPIRVREKTAWVKPGEFRSLLTFVGVTVINVKDLLSMSRQMVKTLNESETEKSTFNHESNLDSGSSGQADTKRPSAAQVDLEGLYRGDLAAPFLAGIAKDISTLPVTSLGSRGSILMIQKRENILHCQTMVEMNNVEIQGAPSANRVIVYEEYFLVWTKDAIVIVRTHVPSINGRTPEVNAWIEKWLTGLRVPATRL